MRLGGRKKQKLRFRHAKFKKSKWMSKQVMEKGVGFTNWTLRKEGNLEVDTQASFLERWQ